MCHTETTNKPQRKPKKQMQKQTILWCPKSRHIHTKNSKLFKLLEYNQPQPTSNPAHSQKPKQAALPNP
jgi:hypothetical protein